MRKLAVFALAAVTSTMLLAQDANKTKPPKDPVPEEPEVTTCETCPAILIDGNSTQIVAVTSTLFVNKAAGDGSYARQNVSSNSGNVTIHKGANSFQLTAGHGAGVVNWAMTADSFASQNLSSNVGKVDIKGNSLQITALKRNSGAFNLSHGKNRAVQNLASNNGCATCN